MSAGSEVFGPYVVYERLGQGGMATVHRAEKRGTGIRRQVALKRLLPHVAADPELVKLFVDEARLASHLHHANVAQTFELGKIGEIFFIAMEYAPGPTLTQVIRQSQKAAGEIPQPVTVNILCQICEALDYAHNLCDETGQHLRIIHRDVSPANILVTNTGVVKLIDFGIAKTALSSVKTQTGFIKGKFGYIAPEYITGKIDKRVDLFAVGVVAHEMLAGRRLFEGKDDFETLANIRDMVMKPPSHWNPHVTPDLDDIVMTALARDPDQRWQSASAMQVALQNAAKEFGLPVGSSQLVEWVEWAFSQEARSSALGGPVLRADPHAKTLGPSLDDDEDHDRDHGRAPSSSISIELSRASSEDITPRPHRRRATSNAADTALLNPRRAMAAAAAAKAAGSAGPGVGSMDETLPVDRPRGSELNLPPRFSRPAIETPLGDTGTGLPRVDARTVDAAEGQIDDDDDDDDDDDMMTREVGSVAPPLLRDMDTESLDETRQVDLVVAPPSRAMVDPIAPPPRAAREMGPARVARETGPAPRVARETGPAPRHVRNTEGTSVRVSRQVASAALPPRSARETAPPPLPQRSARDTASPPRARDTSPPPVPSNRPSMSAMPVPGSRPLRDSSPPPMPARAARESSPPPIPSSRPSAALMPMPTSTPTPTSTLTPTPAPLPSPPSAPMPGLAAAAPRRPSMSYDIDMTTPTPIPQTPSRPKLPFSTQPSRQIDAVEPDSMPASSAQLPRLADASIPPAAAIPPSGPQRPPGMLIVPPGNLVETPVAHDAQPGPELPGPELPGPDARPKQKVKSRHPNKRKAKADEAVPASGPASGPAAVRDSATVAPAPAPARPVAPARKRRAVWLVLLMVILGGGAMAAAYFWPDLQALIDDLAARISG